MQFDDLLRLVAGLPVFESSLLLAGAERPARIHLQLTRWVAAGKLYQLRRGLYALAPPYQSTPPHPFVIANHLVRASYVSAQSALAYHGLIPEAAPVTLSVTGLRPSRRLTPLGHFTYRHLHPRHLRGFARLQVSPGQWAFVAAPEKALLDLIYLTPGGASRAYLSELRLQNLGQLDHARLRQHAERFNAPKLRRAVDALLDLAAAEARDFAPV